MKDWSFVALLGALVAIWYVLSYKESLVPEFLDQGNVKSTSDTRESSYKQETNHFKMQKYKQEPIQGTETPFRVNLYNSFTT
jgi:hypothetical protein